MDWERSCGAIVFTRAGGQLRFIIVQEKEGHYSFPKGHMEGDETEIQTAVREVYEETGLRPLFLEGFRLTDEYELSEKPGVWKRVVYFLAEHKEGTPVARPGEIQKILTLPFEEAQRLFWRANTRRIFAEAYEYLIEAGYAPQSGAPEP